MVTRSGRVVVMDFGIAKGLADQKLGTVSGTPAYMAPEQSRGEEVNARADVFSAGVVLAEMIAPKGLKTLQARKELWEGVHREPPELPDSPWASVLVKAVAHRAQERYASAAALARALEEVTLQVEGAEDVQPYPGMASFTEEDAEYFFGRELEVEAMWKKLRRPHLLGLVGPSGAGKSSFIRAGLLPVRPEGWRVIVTSPGDRPFMNLARVLMRELSGDAQVMEQFLRFEELDVAVSLFRSWRQQLEHGLVIVDQFEELFTLNVPEVQQRFAELLGRLSIEADIHVLLSMRDDFLYHCHVFEPLHPLLTELTLLGAPTGAALRRAVVQPALKCGYRFEDEALVEDILSEVENERGALPMLAFAASRLWEHRDRDRGLLTREAYEHIGGVAGALAQHAEATLEKIGTDRIPIVRELFRNLVTAQGTRASRDREELLSVFEASGASPERQAAEAILSALVDARLLTTYEVPAPEDEASPRTRIEIIHESLLTAWPRLVRWQMQDEEGAKLRDDLRQAAQMWEDRHRSEDLLWTGTAFREFQLWHERYPGGLTEVEESFARAMATKAERKKRRRRFAVAAALVLAFGIAAVTGTLWRRSVAETRRAEAAKLFALGRVEIEDNPTAAIAYATASLELADVPEVRRFALEALYRGPTEFRLTDGRGFTTSFSPDGRWLAIGERGRVSLFSETGGDTVSLPQEQGNQLASFIDSERLLIESGGNLPVDLVRFAESKHHADRCPGPRHAKHRMAAGRGSSHRTLANPCGSGSGTLPLCVSQRPDSHLLRRSRRTARDGCVDLGASMGAPESHVEFGIDPSGTRLIYPEGRSIYSRHLRDFQHRIRVGGHEAPVWSATYDYDSGGERIASVDVDGEIRIWSNMRQSRTATDPPERGWRAA